MSPALVFKGVSFSYRDAPVLRDLDLAVRRGAFFVLIGPNGAGKTTLLKLVAGIVRPDAGRIEVLGRDSANLGPRQRAGMIGLVAQSASEDFPFSVAQTVLMGRAPRQGPLGTASDRDRQVAGQAMQACRIEHLAGRRLGELSGGERQRAFVARALAQEPEVLLLDEPTANLDLSHQVLLMDLMEELRRERSVTVVMVSHDLNLAAMYGDELLLLKDGRPLAQGPPGVVLEHRVLEAAFGCCLLVDQGPLAAPRVTPVPGRFLRGPGRG